MNKKQIGTLILCGCGIAAVVFLLWNYQMTLAFISKVFKIFRPILVGGAIAFILNRPMGKIQEFYQKLFLKKSKKSTGEYAMHIPALITTYILFLAIIVGIVWFIVPQLISSVEFFKDSFDTYYSNLTAFAEAHFSNLNLSFLEDLNITQKLYEWIGTISNRLPGILTTAFGWTANFIGTVTDIFLGLIVSIYILADKKRLRRQVAEIFQALFSQKTCRKVLDFYILCSNTFSSFIGGQLTEACILGLLCFLGMNIFGFDYSVLISVIIGLTNLIPIFGPILGTIPCALILLLVSPKKAILFVVFIIILQQLESNLIYPRVVGSSVGLAPLWTLTAIIIGGGMFGVLGMIFGIPAMSVIYTTVGKTVHRKLKEKEIPKTSNT